MEYDRHHHHKFRFAASFRDHANLAGGRPPAEPTLEPISELIADANLLDELATLLNQLGAAKISMTLYLIEFGGLPQCLARPLLQEAAGSCAMLRLPRPGQHLVIYLGPEPCPERGGFLGRFRRGLAALIPSSMAESAWAEIRSLRRCNHDIIAPAYLLLDLSAAAPRVLGIADW